MADKSRIEPQPPVSQVFEEVPTNRTVETSDYVILNVNGRDIGLVQEVRANQNRPVQWVYEISNITPVEAVPGRFSGTVSLKRIMSFYAEMLDAINYLKSLYDTGIIPEDPTAMYNIAYAVTPIDIMLKFKLPSDLNIQVSGAAMLTDNRMITKTFRECWITKLEFGVTNGDDRMIAESIDFAYRDIVQNALRPASNNVQYTV